MYDINNKETKINELNELQNKYSKLKIYYILYYQ